jgi:hypothetical protein
MVIGTRSEACLPYKAYRVKGKMQHHLLNIHSKYLDIRKRGVQHPH